MKVICSILTRVYNCVMSDFTCPLLINLLILMRRELPVLVCSPLVLWSKANHARDVRFRSKVGQIGLNGTNPGLFQIRFSPCSIQSGSDLSNLGPIWPTLEPNLPSLYQRNDHTLDKHRDLNIKDTIIMIFYKTVNQENRIHNWTPLNALHHLSISVYLDIDCD